MDPDAIARVQCDNLLRVAAFLARASDFVVVGGCALKLHGLDHAPADLDLVPDPSLANLRRLCGALRALGSFGRSRCPSDHMLMAGYIETRMTPVGKVDVMLERGRQEYSGLEQRAVSISVGEHDLRVAAVGDVNDLRVRFRKVGSDA